MKKKSPEISGRIGTAISIARKNANIKQYQLADRVGVTTVYMSQLENNKKLPSIKTLFKIARELNVEPNKLMQGDAFLTEFFRPIKENGMSKEDITQMIVLLKEALNNANTPS
ncbi:MAG: helix-turn-helix transcriptional regulator [Deltaproteobacteria bacterium]|nr:helix-turn-helix transcriptional regulator [Deltaproteobacteria bacterium]